MDDAMEDGTKPCNDTCMKPWARYELWWMDEAMRCQIDEAMECRVDEAMVKG